MAAYELTIKAMSRTDLEEAVIEAASWFRPLEEAPAGPASEGVSGASSAPAGARPRRRGRAAVAPLPAAAHPPAAGAVQADDAAAAQGLAVAGDMGPDAGGADGAVGSQEAGQGEVEAGQAQETGEADPAEAVRAAGAEGAADAGGTAGGGAGDALDSADAAGTADGVGGGEAAAPQEIDISEIKAAAAAAIGKAGFQKVEQVFKELGIVKPGATPPEKRAGALAALKALA